MASPLNADGGGVGAESRIRYEIEQGSSLGQHGDDKNGSFSGGNFNDDDDDDDINSSDRCPTNGRRSPFLNGREGHGSYSAEGEMAEDLASGRQGEDHHHLDDTHKDGPGDGRGAGGNDYDDEAEGNWAALQQAYSDPPPMPGATQGDPAGGGAGAGGGGKRPFSRHRSPDQDHDGDEDDDGRQTHRARLGVMGGATDQEEEDEALVTSSGGSGVGGGGDGGVQRQSSSNQEASRFKQHHSHHQQQPQPKRPGFPTGNRRPFRPGFHGEACNSDDEEGGEDVASSHGGRGGGGREESAGSPSRFDQGGGGGGQSGASAFSESDAEEGNSSHADPWGSSKASQGKSGTREEEMDGEDEGDAEEGGAEGQAQKRQRQQRRKHSEMLVGNSFSAIARCYAAANHAIRGVEADQVRCRVRHRA